MTGRFEIVNADSLEHMPTMEAESIDSIVTDPPYGLSFMGKDWDHGIPGEAFWREAYRVAKPGAHLLAFGGTRTFHRLACAIEDAGWEIRDCVMWVYGSGFPKSLDVSKAIDKAAGAEGEIIGERRFGKTSTGQANGWNTNHVASTGKQTVKAPATDEAKRWNGWGTALKPAWEPIIVARKPLIGTVAQNVLTHATGAINVDGCRIEGAKPETTRGAGGQNGRYFPINAQGRIIDDGKGRFPANLIHDGSDEATDPMGEAQRYFYCAKASKADRDEGCEDLEIKEVHRYGAGIGEGLTPEAPSRNRNHHPTVKPTSLMRYLCRLVTPPDGIILDPFTGSGSTGKGAMLEGFRFYGIEKEAEYAEIARARIAHAQNKSEGELFNRRNDE